MAIARLRAQYPQAGIDLWTEERDFESFFVDSDVDRILFYRHLGDFPSLWRQLRREPLAVKVVLFTDEPTYAKVRLLALALPARRAFACDASGTLTTLGLADLRPTRLLGSNPDVGEGLSDYLRALLRLAGRLLTGLVPLLTFPFVVLYLLLRAAALHARRQANLRSGRRLSSSPRDRARLPGG